MPPRLAPTTIQPIGRELAIIWSDGEESFLDWEILRRACPCAACGGEPDVMGNLERPNVTYTSASFNLLAWQMVGGYAVQPTWGDGHSSGLYPFPYLRTIGQRPAAVASTSTSPE